ncbi:MAG: porin family protein [Cyclobacteriaceae bacterium]
MMRDVVMKKISLLTLLICAIFSANAFAQGPEIGIKAGVNYSNFNSDYDFYEGNVGWHAGIAFGIPITDTYTLQPEILLSMQGVSYVDTDQVEDASNDLLYLNIPVMAKFHFAEVIYLEVGPYVGFMVGQSYERDGEDFDPLDDDPYKNLDFGVAAGAGVAFGPVEIGARYNLGLANIYDTSETVDNPFDPEDDDDRSNSVWQGSIAYYFGR